MSKIKEKKNEAWKKINIKKSKIKKEERTNQREKRSN